MCLSSSASIGAKKGTEIKTTAAERADGGWVAVKRVRWSSKKRHAWVEGSISVRFQRSSRDIACVGIARHGAPSLGLFFAKISACMHIIQRSVSFAACVYYYCRLCTANPPMPFKVFSSILTSLKSGGRGWSGPLPTRTWCRHFPD